MAMRTQVKNAQAEKAKQKTKQKTKHKLVPKNLTVKKRGAPANEPHASHREDLVRLKRISGQIEGIERMVAEGRYCLDIVNQIRSVIAAIKSVESLVLERHLKHCVHDAISAKNEAEVEGKINELLNLFSKR
jgi:CsoR family transcriptional regulator, copper-sensing transcriptional repressor